MTYIEREALGIGKANRDVFENPAYADGWNAAIDIIEAAPAADVVPVKHGRWEERALPLPWCEDDVDIAYVCIVCGSYFDNETFYCPNCGAKMDLEG